MGSRPPAGLSSSSRVGPACLACSAPSDIPVSSEHKHKHRTRLAGLSTFSSRPWENWGKLLTKL